MARPQLIFVGLFCSSVLFTTPQNVLAEDSAATQMMSRSLPSANTGGGTGGPGTTSGPGGYGPSDYGSGGSGNPAIVFRCPDVEGFGFEFTRDCAFGESISHCRREAERDTRDRLRGKDDQIPQVTDTECLLSNRAVGKCTRSTSRASVRTITYYDETTHTVYGEMFYVSRFRCRGDRY